MILDITSERKYKSRWEDAERTTTHWCNALWSTGQWPFQSTIQDDIRNIVERIAVWRLTILLVKICEETDSDERERSRSGARHERRIPVWRRRVKEMTTEEMNESSWSTHERLIRKEQTYDGFAIIERREKRGHTQRVWHGIDLTSRNGRWWRTCYQRRCRARSLTKQICNMQSFIVGPSLRQYVTMKFQLSRCDPIAPNCIKSLQCTFIEEWSRIGDSMSLSLWIIAQCINSKRAVFEFYFWIQ